MQRIYGSRIAPAQDPSQEVVQRLAEMGYQLEPAALKIICGYPGSKEELLRRIVGSTDRSVAVIDTARVSCLLPSFPVPPLLTDRQPLSPLSAPSFLGLSMPTVSSPVMK